MMTPSDVVVGAWRLLDAEQREAAFLAISDLRLRELAGEASEGETYLAALRLVAERIGRPPAPADYDEARRLLAEEGHQLPPRSRMMRHFGSWKLAKEALGLVETETARRIEARFRFRRIGKVWRYTDETLAEAMASCVADVGRPPRVAEFEWWRERELQLAKARGDDGLHLPSPSPYRKRWKTWDAALLALGYSPEWIAERLDETRASVASRP